MLTSGGSFPLPPAAAQLCTMLPPPQCFRGPFVSTDMLIDVFSRIQLPDRGLYRLKNRNNGNLEFQLFKFLLYWIKFHIKIALTLNNLLNKLIFFYTSPNNYACNNKLGV